MPLIASVLVPARRLLVWACLALPATALAGCAAIVGQAPFPQNPQTTEPGDLLGPFDGAVIDAETERPIPGALVSATWIFERGVGTSAPKGAEERSLKTNTEGRYEFFRLDQPPTGLSARVARFRLVIYKRGYIGYRSDHVFPDGALRRDFAQEGHVVRLEKAPADLSHSSHLAFLAGNPAIRRAAAWELAEAGLEVRKRIEQDQQQDGTAPAEATLLDVSRMLVDDEIRARTGYKGQFQTERMPDLPRSQNYDSTHFRAVEKGEHYDVAFKVWVLGPQVGLEEYRKLLGALPQVRPSEDAGTRSFRAGEGDLLAVIFLDEPTGVLVQVTCGIGQCRDHSIVAQLAKVIASRVPGLVKK
jgi:hypothetical protein